MVEHATLCCTSNRLTANYPIALNLPLHDFNESTSFATTVFAISNPVLQLWTQEMKHAKDLVRWFHVFGVATRNCAATVACLVQTVQEQIPVPIASTIVTAHNRLGNSSALSLQRVIKPKVWARRGATEVCHRYVDDPSYVPRCQSTVGSSVRCP